MHKIGTLLGVNAKQHIIKDLCDQQMDLINCNISNNTLFHNLPEDPMESVRPRQNPDGLYNDSITTRSIINTFLVEVMETDSKVVHNILFECHHRLTKCVQ